MTHDSGIMSLMLHLLDQLAHGLMRMPGIVPRLFPEGWGNQDVLDDFWKQRRHPPSVTPFDIAWSLVDTTGTTQVGSFESPCGYLPAASRSGRILWVGPDHNRQVVVLAASNDHTWSAREAVAGRLASMGIGSLILENPYYGGRRCRDGQPLATVADFFRMGAATVAEARYLLAYLAELGAVPGVAGFSQGGSIAAYVSALAPVPVATACLAAGPSPGPVFTRGVLTSTVDWPALGGRAAALPRLQAMLDDVTVTRYAPQPHTTAAVLAGARRDAYVPPSEIEALSEHWPGAEIVWLDGGHASFHLYGKATQATLIARAFERFVKGA